MQLFDRLVEAWPERTIVPSLAERWEISDDGLRYVFHLREGLRWSDGTPLTAHDVEFGIKRVLDPERPGSSVAIYFVLENGEDYYLGRNADADAIGVRALDDRTVEFRLVAPAPYFMSVMNRPDGGPQPRHAIERDGDDWTEPERQVVSGPFAVAERTDERARARAARAARRRPGNVARGRALPERSRRRARAATSAASSTCPRPLHASARRPDARRGARTRSSGPPAWSAYLALRPHASGRRRTSSFVARSRTRSTATRSRRVLPANLVVATGGVVPPALQGHTPDIAPRFDPDLARESSRGPASTGRSSSPGSTVWDDDPRARRRRRGATCSAARGRRPGRGARRRPAAGERPETRRRSASPAGCRATPTPSTSSACCSSRRAGRTRAASPTRPSTS